MCKTCSKRSRLSRRQVTLMMGGSALAVAGCAGNVPKHLRPLPYAVVADLEQKGLTKGDPILIRIYKQESELEVWKKKRSTGKFVKFKSYEICKWSGDLGPKFKEGDRQTPEGFYHVTPALMNPNSSYHLSFNLGFPNSFDRSHGRTGSFLMVHGACSSRGCYAMGDPQVEEIYALAREAFDSGQKSFQVQAYPFRMVPENFAKHHSSPHMGFWRMLKNGHDHFEVTLEEPRVTVCDRRYVFNADTGRYALDATRQCPDYEVPESLDLAVRERQAADLIEERKLLAELQSAEPIVEPLATPGSAEPVVTEVPEVSTEAAETLTADTAAVEPSILPEPRPSPNVANGVPSIEPETGRRGLLSRLRGG